MPDYRTAWDRFYEEQQSLATTLKDPSNQALGTVAIISGVVSSLALAKLYTKLSKEPVESPMQVIAGRGLTAMALGVVYVWWELNKTQFQSRDDLLALWKNEEEGPVFIESEDIEVV